MTKWLHRNSFSYRKPVGIPHKFSAEAQQVFVETYNELKQKAGDNESILNPIKRLWKVMNEHVRNNRYFASPKVFRQQIHHFFRNILPGLAGFLSRRINDNFQTLKNAISS